MPPKKGHKQQQSKQNSATIDIQVKPTGSNQPGRRRSRRSKGRQGSASSNILKNIYLQSLFLPPLTTAKIPDPSSLLTSTCQMTYDLGLNANAQQVCGFLLTLKSFSAANSGYSTAVYLEDSASVDTGFTYSGGATYFPGSGSFANSFSASRLVSASAEIEFLGSTLNDQGRLYMSSHYSTRFIAESVPATTVGMLSARDNTSMRVTSGGFCRWKPGDNTCDDFGGPTTTNPLGSILFHVSGVAVGTPFRIRLTANYECLPLTDSLSYTTASTSPVDLSMYSAARTAIAKVSSFDTYDNLSSTLARGAAGLGGTAAALFGPLYADYHTRRNMGRGPMAAPAA
jgi:hypothetical protein